MKQKIFLGVTFLLSILIISCSKRTSEDASGNLEIEKFKLASGTITNLSPLSVGQTIFKIEINEHLKNSYEVVTSYYQQDGKVGVRKFNIHIQRENLKIENDGAALLVNHLTKNCNLITSHGNELVNEQMLATLNTSEMQELKRLTFLFLELYDKDIMKLGSKATSSIERVRCYKFESGIGLTSTAAQQRAEDDANAYINDGHSDCTIVGNDVSCAIDAHICVSTVTMRCSSSCNWWN